MRKMSIHGGDDIIRIFNHVKQRLYCLMTYCVLGNMTQETFVDLAIGRYDHKNRLYSQEKVRFLDTHRLIIEQLYDSVKTIVTFEVFKWYVLNYSNYTLNCPQNCTREDVTSKLSQMN